MKTSGHRERGEHNRQWGIEAETLAYEHFLKEGYTIRERNWKSGKLELDLILERDRTIVFVEVKARASNSQDPATAVDHRKRKNMIRAAEVYMEHLEILYQYRFDIFTITGDAQNHTFSHYEDAFLPPVNGLR